MMPNPVSPPCRSEGIFDRTLTCYECLGEYKKFSSLEIIKCNKGSFNLFGIQPRWECCYSSRPQASLQYHTMTAIEDNKFIVIGGLTANRLSSTRTLQGTYDSSMKGSINDIKAISWKEFDSLNEGRHDHFAFMMKQSIIVAGGDQNSAYSGANYLLSCERYNFKSEKWEMSPHKLPFPIIKIKLMLYLNKQFLY